MWWINKFLIILFSKFNLNKSNATSFNNIKKLISIKENLPLVKKYKENKKNGISKNSIFKFRFKVFEASNFVINICDVHEKIAHKENIFVNNKIFWLYSSFNQKLKKSSYNGNRRKIKIGIISKKTLRA